MYTAVVKFPKKNSPINQATLEKPFSRNHIHIPTKIKPIYKSTRVTIPHSVSATLPALAKKLLLEFAHIIIPPIIRVER